MTPEQIHAASVEGARLRAPSDERERDLVRGILLAMRLQRSVSTLAELAAAIGFVVCDGPWTTYAGMVIALPRDLPEHARSMAIARGIAHSVAEWVPGVSAARVEIELRAVFASATASALASSQLAS